MTGTCLSSLNLPHCWTHETGKGETECVPEDKPGFSWSTLYTALFPELCTAAVFPEKNLCSWGGVGEGEAGSETIAGSAYRLIRPGFRCSQLLGDVSGPPGSHWACSLPPSRAQRRHQRGHYSLWEGSSQCALLGPTAQPPGWGQSLFISDRFLSDAAVGLEAHLGNSAVASLNALVLQSLASRCQLR